MSRYEPRQHALLVVLYSQFEFNRLSLPRYFLNSISRVSFISVKRFTSYAFTFRRNIAANIAGRNILGGFQHLSIQGNFDLERAKPADVLSFLIFLYFSRRCYIRPWKSCDAIFIFPFSVPIKRRLLSRFCAALKGRHIWAIIVVNYLRLYRQRTRS